mmetsp:Transcript_912/g.2376  ORF Transcript_912/g.2376 Transcript_912/m.2376 type:complete len:232 (+) Transcript_912:827-1522(+)
MNISGVSSTKTGASSVPMSSRRARPGVFGTGSFPPSHRPSNLPITHHFSFVRKTLCHFSLRSSNSYLISFLFLAFDMGNEQSTPHEPSPYSSVASSTSGTKPLKSSLRRSRSIRSEADTAGPLPDRTRYIPKMSAAKSSLIMPTRPFGNDTANSGMESPQLGYGFYTNLTPPTPEMYQSYQSSKYPKSNFGQPHTGASALSVSARSQQNQVFQNLQNNQAAMAPSWTSVPI